MSSYDIGEQQVCVYFDDPGHCWHIRILVVPLGAGRWLACSSDYDVEIIDLALCLVIPLERAQPLPAPGLSGPMLQRVGGTLQRRLGGGLHVRLALGRLCSGNVVPAIGRRDVGILLTGRHGCQEGRWVGRGLLHKLADEAVPGPGAPPPEGLPDGRAGPQAACGGPHA